MSSTCSFRSSVGTEDSSMDVKADRYEVVGENVVEVTVSSADDTGDSNEEIPGEVTSDSACGDGEREHESRLFSGG